MILQFFFDCLDPEINRNCLEIISVLCKHIILNNLDKKKSAKLTERIIHFLESDFHEEYEAALQCLHNLMLSQENEMSIETMFPTFLDSLVKSEKISKKLKNLSFSELIFIRSDS